MNRGPTPSPLPEPFAGIPFTVAEGRASGISKERMKRADLDRTVHGVRAAPGSTDTLEGRCRLYAARLGEPMFFSHETAARLLGLPLPLHVESDSRLHATVASPRRAPHAAGLVGHSRLVFEGDITTLDGLRLSSPARVWCELARRLPVPDLVAVADAIVSPRHQLATTTILAQRIARGDPISRAGALRLALPLVDGRSESRPESILRVILVLGGIPCPVINHVVVATADGRRGIRTDFAYPHLRFAIEYQGDYHRTRQQWREDMTRRSRLEALGWYILEVNWDDLRRPEDLLGRVRATLARRA